MMNYWITVVDDDAMCMANTKSILTERNMRVSCLRSGVNFMRFIKSNTPDLVLLDIMMPGTDGSRHTTICGILRKKPGVTPFR